MNRHGTTTIATTAAATEATWVRRVIAVSAFAALSALGARLSVPLPGTPVPFTLQPVAVLLAGLLLGARAGAASQLTYLAAGAMGLPVFAAGGGLAYLAGPTGGYLLAFPVAAALAGWIAGNPDMGSTVGRVTRVVTGSVVGLTAVHLCGAAWLSLQPWFAGDSADVFRLTFEPFLIGDLFKVALVGVVALGLSGRVRRLLG